MNESTMRPGFRGTSIALAFLGGAAAGAAMALLWAPRTGAETRRKISGAVERSGSAVRRTRIAAGDAVRAAREVFADALKGA